MNMKRLVWGCCVVVSVQAAEERGYIDAIHDTISAQVSSLACNIDTALSDTVGYFRDDLNTTSSQQSADSFFQSEKFLEETDRSYIRIRTQQQFNTRDADKTEVSLSAVLTLNKSRRHALFITGVDDENIQNIYSDSDTADANTPEIGIRYIESIWDAIDAKYRLGVRSAPFVRARYSIDYKLGRWTVEPVQTFEYSTKDRFSEKTDLYVDSHFDHNILLRLRLFRETKELEDGMGYGFNIQWYWPLFRHTSLRFSQGFYGHTDYNFVPDNGGLAYIYNGIYDYVTTLTWRQNIWRKWLYYQIAPGVNYHKTHRYQPNYRVWVALDFYFGHAPQ